MTSEELQLLVNRGGREWRVELIDGRLMVDWTYEYIAGPQEARAMAALGVHAVRTALDSVLDDDECREEARRRLCARAKHHDGAYERPPARHRPSRPHAFGMTTTVSAGAGQPERSSRSWPAVTRRW